MALTELAGLADLHAGIEDARHKINAAAMAAVSRSAEEVADTARSLVPIGETEDLLESIEVEEHGLFASVNAGDEETGYAGYVEFGVGEPEQPFMRPAATVGKRALPDAVAAEINGAFGSG